jgi:hypothetical protein
VSLSEYYAQEEVEMAKITLNEALLLLVKDSKKQWSTITKLNASLVATQSFQFSLMSTLSEFCPPLHKKIIDGLDVFLHELEEKGIKNSVVSEYFKLLSDATAEQQSVLEELMRDILSSELPLDDDMFQ